MTGSRNGVGTTRGPGRRRCRRSDASGQATVELALLLPVICGLLVLAFEVGGVVRSQVLLVQLTRQVARDAALAAGDGDVGGVLDGAAAARASGLDPADLQLEIGPAGSGDGLITVRASYRRSVGVPLLGVARRQVTLTSQLTVRPEES
jgi:Flp pilus assembly protein TadG